MCDIEKCDSDCNEGDKAVNEVISNDDDSAVDAMKSRAREMEEEAEKLRQLQQEVDKQMSIPLCTISARPSYVSIEEKIEIDNRSIYIGNVDYSATVEQIEQHFRGCGGINRVTIPTNKFNGQPKGFAYIEFADNDAVGLANAMDDSLFKGRQIKVLPKRTNRPGLSTTNRPPRDRGTFRGSRYTSRGFHGGFRPIRKIRAYRRSGYSAPF